MGKLHELLAAETTAVSASKKLLEDTRTKFAKKDDYFMGNLRTLTMLKDSVENEAIQAAARQEKELPTTVYDTLEYFFQFWAKAEDVMLQKNCTNQVAKADLMFKGEVLARNLPVDELMGLEARLKELRGLAQEMPTLDASKKWKNATDRGDHVFVTEAPEVQAKTEKIIVPVELSPATDKHPAQVKETSREEVVGKFENIRWSGAATTLQKAQMIEILDELIVEARQARNRANMVETVDARIGQTLINTILRPFK